VGNLFELYEVDRAAFSDGVPVELDGCIFKVRYAGAENMAYQAALGMSALQHRELFEDVQANAVRLSQIEPEITAAAMFQTVVTGWDNVCGRDGNPLAFTRENFTDLMLSCPRVFMTIRTASERFAAYRAKRAEEAADNLGKSSSGPESGGLGSQDSKPSEQADSASPPSSAGP
jgi:hypothetical protein